MTRSVTCHYTVVRYVPDPIRNEPRNVGIIVLAPEAGFGAIKWSLARAQLRPGTSRYRILRSLLESYQLEIPSEQQLSLFETSVPQGWTSHDLLRLSQECTNIVQFSPPQVIFGEPHRVLTDLFQERISQRGRPRGGWGKATVVRELLKPFKRAGKPEYVQQDPSIKTRLGEVVFDVGIRNGRWTHVIQTLSFRRRDLQGVEQAAGWFALVWSKVRDEVGAKAIWLAEIPEERSREGRERYERAHAWADEQEIEVYAASQVRDVAARLVKEALPGIADL